MEMTVITFKQTWKDAKADIVRRLVLEGKKQHAWNMLFALPKRGVTSALLYRIKRYLFFKNRMARVLVRLLKFVEFHYCHNELDPRAEIGPGLVLSNLGGVGLGFMVIIGENCTFMGKATPTLGAMEGIDLAVDRIRIGNHCVIGHNVKVIHAVDIADGTQISPNAVLMSAVNQPGSIMAGFPARKIREVPLALVKSWSPLLSKSLVVNA